MTADVRVSPFSIVPVEAALDHRLTAMQYRVLIAILSFRNRNSDTTYAGRDAIARRCGYSISNVSKVTGQLVDLGWLVKAGKGGRSRATRYRVTVPDELPETLPGFGLIEPPETVSNPETVSDPDTVSAGKRCPTRTLNGVQPGHTQGTEVEHKTPSPARACATPVDNSGTRRIEWRGSSLQATAAPDALTDETIHELLEWLTDRDPKWRPSVSGLNQILLEIRKAADAGWDPNQAVAVWMAAGWTTFFAHYLDEKASNPGKRSPAAGGGMSGTARRVGDRLRANEQDRQRRKGDG